MTVVNCKVEECSHNEGGCCYADRVNIGGKSAVDDEQTCCGSYLNSLLYGNLTNCATTESGKCDCLVCYVKSCQHNENSLCNLADIEVGGQNASIYTETRCNSFECK